MIIKQRMTEIKEIDLVKAAKTDPQAFDMLYRRHVTAVYRYCLAQSGSVAEAEDLTAQVFLVALETLPKYRGHGSFAAWLFGIARRKCTDFHRRRYRKRDDSLETAASLPDRDAITPEQNAYQHTVWACVRRQLEQLSQNRREALYLRFWGGLSVNETAAAMRKSPGAVKMLVSRAIADLKERCITHE